MCSGVWRRGGAMVMNIYRALAHSRAAMLHFMRLGSSYEWAQHVVLARECGVTPEQMEAMGEWSSSTVFDARDRAVLAYTDEVSQQVRVQDATFQEVARYLDEDSIVELTLCVGFWGMVARLLEALQVDLDQELPGSSREVMGNRPR